MNHKREREKEGIVCGIGKCTEKENEADTLARERKNRHTQSQRPRERQVVKRSWESKPSLPRHIQRQDQRLRHRRTRQGNQSLAYQVQIRYNLHRYHTTNTQRVITRHKDLKIYTPKTNIYILWPSRYWDVAHFHNGRHKWEKMFVICPISKMNLKPGQKPHHHHHVWSAPRKIWLIPFVERHTEER